jgi:hypothetical protein
MASSLFVTFSPIIGLFIFGLIIVCIPAIFAFVLAGHELICDNIGFGLSIQNYLVMQGSYNIALYLFAGCLALYEMYQAKKYKETKSFFKCQFVWAQCVCAVAALIIIVIGFVLLFHFNLSCLNSSNEVAFAFGFLGFSVLQFIVTHTVWLQLHMRSVIKVKSVDLEGYWC